MFQIQHNATGAIRVDFTFKALDRLLDFLESDQQKQIDALTAQVGKLTQGLKQSGDALQQSVTDELKS